MTCCVGWGTARNFDDYTSKCPTVGEPLLIGPQGALNSGGLDFCVLIFWHRKIKSDSGGMCLNGLQQWLGKIKIGTDCGQLKYGLVFLRRNGGYQIFYYKSMNHMNKIQNL